MWTQARDRFGIHLTNAGLARMFSRIFLNVTTTLPGSGCPFLLIHVTVMKQTASTIWICCIIHGYMEKNSGIRGTTVQK